MLLCRHLVQFWVVKFYISKHFNRNRLGYQKQCAKAQMTFYHSVELIWRLHFDGSDILHNDEPIDIGLSFDGSWHSRGHNSRYGFVSVIAITTGHVVYYEILCRYCQNYTSYQNKYGVDSEQYKEWYQTHAQSCQINYTRSSNAMEMEGAKRIWSCSVEKNNMRYVRMLGDGDSKVALQSCT